MSWLFRNRYAALWLALVAVWMPQQARAQSITEQVPLSFGRIAILSYVSVGRITINPGGGYSTNAEIAVIDPPVQGEYLVNGPASTSYTITVSPSVNLVGPGGAFFTLDNFEVRPLTLTTDGTGADTFFLTGRLQTQGGGMSYLDGSYNGTVSLTIAF